MKRAILVLVVTAVALASMPDAPAQDPADDPNLKKLQELRFKEFVKELSNKDSIRRGAAIDSLKGLALPKAFQPLLETAVDERYGYLASFAAEHLPGREVDTRVLEGVPWETIVLYAKNEEIDLLVMGMHGHGFVGHILTGSTTERVLHQAPCPVLVCRHE